MNRFALVTACAVVAVSWTSAGTLDDVRRVESIYAKHRAESTGSPAAVRVPKDDVLAARIADSELRENALRRIYGRTITGPMVQAELDRMARTTRDAARLAELWDALERDPHRIANAIVRPLLSEALLRSQFEIDPAVIEPVRREAEKALAALPPGGLSALPNYQVVRIERADRDDAPGHSALTAGPERWNALHASLRASLHVGADRALPLGTHTGLIASKGSFAAVSVVHDDERAIELGIATWELPSFEAWWGATRTKLAPETVKAGVVDAALHLPAITGGCTDDTWSPLQNEPSARESHSAVWTGSEMIVLGGSWTAASGLYWVPVNDGARYDPATDSWRPVSKVGAAYSDAVWTGSRMIVWAGFASYDPGTDTWAPIAHTTLPAGARAVWADSRLLVWSSGSTPGGAAYDPATDTWTPIPVSGAPSGLYYFTSVWSGAELIVWGSGWSTGAAGGAYRPATGTWRTLSTTDQPTPRSGHAAVWTGKEMIIWYAPESDIPGAYDPATDTWRRVNCWALDGQEKYTAVWTGTRVLTFGGRRFQIPSWNGGTSYDPTTDTCSPIPSVGPGRSGHTAVWTGTEMIIWGGRTEIGIETGTLSTGYRFDPVASRWTPVRSVWAPRPRIRPAVQWSGAELLVWGGEPIDWYLDPRDGGRYDPALNTWRPIYDCPACGAERVASAWSGSELLLWGGRDASGSYYNTGSRYDPAADRWTAMSAVTAVPRVATGAWTGSLFAFYGGRGEFGLTNDGWLYDPAADQWRKLPEDVADPSFRTGHTFVSAGDDLIVWGGSNGQQVLDTGSRYSIAQDRWDVLPQGPLSARADQASTWTGRELIVHGGSNGTVLSDGARFDPSTNQWTSMAVLGAPSVSGSTMVWTGREAIEFAGARYEPLSDTWAPISTIGAPPGTGHGAAWTGTAMIAWGGLFPGGASYCAACTPTSWYRDADGDGHGDPLARVDACRAPVGYVAAGDDCDDANAAIHPGAIELCNGVDDDCNVATVDGSGEPWLGAPCDGPDADLCAEGTFFCSAGAQACSDVSDDTLELCDASGLDEDCDGLVNEDPEAALHSCTDVDVCTSAACVAGGCDYRASGSCSLSGRVLYYRDVNGNEPANPRVGVSGVSLSLTGDSTAVGVSDAEGRYTFPGVFHRATVSATARRETVNDASITSNDAVAAAKAAMGLVVLTPQRALAGDVTGDGHVSLYDAALIAAYSVGLVVPTGFVDPDPSNPALRFPAAARSGSDWTFVPGSVTRDVRTGPVDGVDLRAILYGELTGNWPVVERTRSQRPVATAERAATLHAGDAIIELTARPAGRERWTVTIALRTAGVRSLGIAWTRRAGGEIRSARLLQRSDDRTLLENHAGGIDRVGVFGAIPMTANAPVIELTVTGTAPSQFTDELVFEADEVPVR